MSTTFHEHAKKQNAASRDVEALFLKYQEKTGITLSASSTMGKKVIFEENKPHDSWPTKRFKNDFDCWIKMHDYFQEALAEFI